MQKTVLPAAENTFSAVQTAYQVGEQDYLELLDAQRTLLQIRRDRLELLSELLEQKTELEGITGQFPDKLKLLNYSKVEK